jgi:YTH domain-containing family protein
MSSNFDPGQITSPPLADSGVRRHQSLTYGAKRTATGLRRAGTLQAASAMKNSTAPRSPSPTNAEEAYEQEETPYADDSYFSGPQQQQQQQQTQVPPQPQSQGQYGGSPSSRSPWGTPGEWRAPANGTGYAGGGVAIDDVQRALATLELAGQQGLNYGQNGV